ncbi:ferredoxin 1b [Stegostoma tigrinum]|uniref:ferredoxin 1b n=1 Tax=Stegostoma tigrinum TaxID=3053191 RepID=UPI00287092D1|nr:ferredoxin 1b [Stegostoma tigrinum]
MMMARGVFKLQSLSGVLCGKSWIVEALTVKRVVVCRAAVNQQERFFCSSTASEGDSRSDEKLMVHFINRDNEKLTVLAKEGESLLDVVIKNNLDINGFGACEGTLACSTCHVIFDKEVFENLDEITDEEMDMLDLAFGLTRSSRLGCQICLKKSLDGITVKIPKDVSDVRESKGQ